MRHNIILSFMFLAVILLGISLTSCTISKSTQQDKYIEYYKASEALIHSIEEQNQEFFDDILVEQDEFYEYIQAKESLKKIKL